MRVGRRASARSALASPRRSCEAPAVEIRYRRFVRTALTPAETTEVERVDDLALQLSEHLQASAAEIDLVSRL